ncbi:MAG TPA: M17 family peptidase N-terminal domain-containing protein [Myxococcaceae bacterium]|nr:M17 family peptidase N-terminal domain-containing protein [Myxococcaceae bacterium]
MKISAHDIGVEPLDALSWIEALCLFIREDERPLRGMAGFADWRMCGKLSRVLMENFFKGELSETLLLPTDGRLALPRIFAFGLGSAQALSGDRIAEALTHAGRALSRAGIQSVAMELPGAGLVAEEERVRLWTHSFAATFRGNSVAALTERAVAKLLPEHLPSVAA